MRIPLFGLFLCGVVLPLCSCAKKAPNRITIEEMFRTHGVPVVIGSDNKIDRDQPLLTVTLYGVSKRVSVETTKELKAGQVVVFCSDPRFRQWVGIHFANMHDPYQYSGSTMFASLFRDDTKLTIFRIAEDGNAELQYSDYVMVVYLEVGDKDHLIRVRPLKPKSS